MEALDRLKSFIEGSEERDFYKYLIIALGVTTLLIGGIIVYYYSNVVGLKKKIKDINDFRVETKEILNKNALVEQQRNEVNDMLKEHRDFRIDQYFEEKLIPKLQLADKKKIYTTTQEDRDTEYRERSLNAKFTDMDTKQVCELLNEIEQNTLIYTKELEITKSKKQPPTLEVNLTIATLELKTGPTEFVE